MEKKTSKNILLQVMGLLVVVSLIATVFTISTNAIGGICTLISLIMTALYVFVLYKIPHGNMLKYAIIVFAVTKVISAAAYIAGSGNVYTNALVALCSCAMCYCAGRLNRIEQNRILFPIIEIVTIGIAATWLQPFTDTSSIFLNIRCLAYPLIFATIMIAYFARYEEHKLAGLIDAPKN